MSLVPPLPSRIAGQLATCSATLAVPDALTLVSAAWERYGSITAPEKLLSELNRGAFVKQRMATDRVHRSPAAVNGPNTGRVCAGEGPSDDGTVLHGHLAEQLAWHRLAPGVSTLLLGRGSEKGE